MEKDYFLDRPLSVREHLQVYNGRMAFICTKDAQKYAKTLNDLKLIKIGNSHTSVGEHPRGQKVTGTLVLRDDYGNYINGDLVEEKGRCTYFVDKDGVTVDTKEGTKKIVYSQRDGLHLVKEEVLENSFQIYSLFNIYDGNGISSPFDIKCLVFPYLYFINKDDLKEFISSFDSSVNYAFLKKGMIQFSLLNKNMYVKDDFIFVRDSKIIQSEIAWSYLVHNITPIRPADMPFNYEYPLVHIGYSPKQIKGQA